MQPSGAAIRVPISILWLTSPVNPRKIFSACIGRIAVEVALFAILLATPVIDVPAVLGGARWLAAYSVVAAITICGHFDVANQFHPRDRWAHHHYQPPRWSAPGRAVAKSVLQFAPLMCAPTH